MCWWRRPGADPRAREPVIYSWENMRRWVYETREMIDTPEVWANFEYLYDEVRGLHPQTQSKDEMIRNLKELVGPEDPDP